MSGGGSGGGYGADCGALVTRLNKASVGGAGRSKDKGEKKK